MIQKALTKVMTHEKAVITDWCSRNAVQMQNALHAVTELQDRAGHMEGELQESQEQLTVCPVARLHHVPHNSSAGQTKHTPNCFDSPRGESAQLRQQCSSPVDLFRWVPAVSDSSWPGHTAASTPAVLFPRGTHAAASSA